MQRLVSEVEGVDVEVYERLESELAVRAREVELAGFVADVDGGAHGLVGHGSPIEYLNDVGSRLELRLKRVLPDLQAQFGRHAREGME